MDVKKAFVLLTPQSPRFVHNVLEEFKILKWHYWQKLRCLIPFSDVSSEPHNTANVSGFEPREKLLKSQLFADSSIGKKERMQGSGFLPGASEERISCSALNKEL
ncbi:hypothetical protein ACTXT7_011887 [Hymenolepis weldensis]